MVTLLEGRYGNCEKVIVVCDNLNTHTKGAFYETFEPARARTLVSRIDFHYTPKHGSWLNIAENELSSMTRQCVAGRRIVTRNDGMARGRQLRSKRRRMADEDRRRSHKTNIRLP